MGVAKKTVRDWIIRDHRKHWDSLSGLKQAKGPSAKKTRKLLNLNKDQLRWVVGLLTGHLFKVGLVNSPRYEKCLEKEESFTHILCDCQAIAYSLSKI
jgi:hypothetical protein